MSGPTAPVLADRVPPCKRHSPVRDCGPAGRTLFCMTDQEPFMTSVRFPRLTASLATIAVVTMSFGVPMTDAAADTVTLASHRAVYDLKLGKSRGKRTVESVRGRLLYDFSGSVC